MFWKVSSFSSGSAVEGILDKQQVTLEELLEEDELVQVSSNMPSLHSNMLVLKMYHLLQHATSAAMLINPDIL